MVAEGEEVSDQDVVVVIDKRISYRDSGAYALARASEWCAMKKTLTIWRGPHRPDEVVPVEFFQEVSCKSLQVDEKGYFVCVPTDEPIFYPCPGIDEEVWKAVKDEVEEILNQVAARQQAEAQSYVDHEVVTDILGSDWSRFVWAIAEIDDAFAVNGDFVGNNKSSRPPKGWKKTDKGGRFD